MGAAERVANEQRPPFQITSDGSSLILTLPDNTSYFEIDVPTEHGITNIITPWWEGRVIRLRNRPGSASQIIFLDFPAATSNIRIGGLASSRALAIGSFIEFIAAADSSGNELWYEYKTVQGGF